MRDPLTRDFAQQGAIPLPANQPVAPSHADDGHGCSSAGAALFVLPMLVACAAQADELPPDRINPKGHAGDVLAVGYTPDGKTLVTAGSDGLAKIWDVATRTVRADLAGHEGKVLRVAVSPTAR